MSSPSLLLFIFSHQAALSSVHFLGSIICHAAAPEDNKTQRASGWFANNVGTWITPFTPTTRETLQSSVYITGSFLEAPPACLDEYATDGSTSSCALTEDPEGVADANVYLADLADVVDNHRSGGQGDAFHNAFSTNKVVGPNWLAGFFRTLAQGVRNNTTPRGTALSSAVQFSTLDTLRTVNRLELGL